MSNKLKELLFSIASLNCNGLEKTQDTQRQSNFHALLILSKFQHSGILSDSHFHMLCKLHQCTFSSISAPMVSLLRLAFFFFLFFQLSAVRQSDSVKPEHYSFQGQSSTTSLCSFPCTNGLCSSHYR